MEENKTFEERYNALSEDQKKSFTFNLLRQNQQLAEQVTFKRLDYLFKIVDNPVFPEELINKATKDIEMLLFGDPEEEYQDTQEDGK